MGPKFPRLSKYKARGWEAVDLLRQSKCQLSNQLGRSEFRIPGAR